MTSSYSALFFFASSVNMVLTSLSRNLEQSLFVFRATKVYVGVGEVWIIPRSSAKHICYSRWRKIVCIKGKVNWSKAKFFDEVGGHMRFFFNQRLSFACQHCLFHFVVASRERSRNMNKNSIICKDSARSFSLEVLKRRFHNHQSSPDCWKYWINKIATIFFHFLDCFIQLWTTFSTRSS